MRIALLALAVALSSGGCLLRSTLPAKVGESRVVLWDGVDLEGAGGAETYLEPRTVARVTAVKGSDCQVTVSGAASVSGGVSCRRLGQVAARPTPLYVKPGGPVRLEVNGGVLLALKERKGEWLRVAGDAIQTFDGWVKATDVAVKAEKSWLAPGLPPYPWKCSDGSWLYDKPKGTFLMWIPSSWCRVKLLERRKGWARVRYLDSQIKVEGWLEAGDIEPDREPRFHPGARVATVLEAAEVYATPTEKKPFGSLTKGLRVWASLSDRGRVLVQSYGDPVEVVGWVEAPRLK